MESSVETGKPIEVSATEIAQKHKIKDPRNIVNWYQNKEKIETMKNTRVRLDGGGRSLESWKQDLFEKLHLWFSNRRVTLQIEVQVWDLADAACEIATENNIIQFDPGFTYFFFKNNIV